MTIWFEFNALLAVIDCGPYININLKIAKISQSSISSSYASQLTYSCPLRYYFSTENYSKSVICDSYCTGQWSPKILNDCQRM